MFQTLRTIEHKEKERSIRQFGVFKHGNQCAPRHTHRPPTSDRTVEVYLTPSLIALWTFALYVYVFCGDEYRKRMRERSRRHCFKRTLNHMCWRRRHNCVAQCVVRKGIRQGYWCWWFSFIKTVTLSAITRPCNVFIHSYLLRRFNHKMSTNLIASFFCRSSRLF